LLSLHNPQKFAKLQNLLNQPLQQRLKYKKTIIIETSELTTTTTQYEGDDATEVDLSKESFGSIISKTNK